MTTTDQTRALLTWFARGSARSLAITLAIASAVAAGIAVLAAVQGWTDGPPAPTDVDGTVIVGFTTTLFGIPLVAVAIASFVMAIVQVGAYTRALVATGATRTSLAAAHLVHALGLAVAVTAVAAVVLALEAAFAGGWIGSTFGLAPGDTFADGVPALASGLGATLVAALAGSALAATFVRWRWWVGVGALATVLWLVPLLAAWLEPLGAALEAFRTWPGALVVVAVVLAGAHWAVMRRLAVP